MSGLTVYPLRFTLRAIDPVFLGDQAGAQLRGVLYTALRELAESLPSAEHGTPRLETDPIRWLMAREDESAQRGKDVPRPFTVQPPLEAPRRYPHNTDFTIGITLFGTRTLALLPLIVSVFPRMGRLGIGPHRARFVLQHITLLNADESQTLLMQHGDPYVQLPQQGITQQSIAERAATLSTSRLTLHFHTPTRLIYNHKLLKEPLFHVLMARLIERYDALGSEYGENFTPLPHAERLDLLARAERVQLLDNRTRWKDVYSHSRRTGSGSPIGGLIGEATYSGDLAPFREWLLWGTFLQVGKHTVKGDGCYSVH